MKKIGIFIIRLVIFISLIFSALIAFAFIYPIDINEPSYSMVNKVTQTYFPLTDSEIDQLEEKFGFNKTIPPPYRMQMLIALSHFPELVNTNIIVRVARESSFPLVSRPQITSMITPGEERKYIILINDNEEIFPDNLLLKNIPFNGQIGILGHELSHVVFYTRQNNLELLAIGIRYLFNNFQEKFEKSTDISTIRHGLGWQLLEFSNFVRNQTLEKRYQSWLENNYLSPGEIEEIMKRIMEYNMLEHGQNQ